MVEKKEEKKVSVKNGVAKLVAQYNLIKDLNSPEARKIRKQFRDMGTSIREVLDDKPKKTSAPVKLVKKANKTVKEVDDVEEEE